jgi:urea transport system ATP-binding protein
VPQGRGIFPHLSVHENLLIGLEAASDQGDDDGEIEAMYKLFPALKIDPNKLGGTLSGGQQQQLALARALVRRPRLLLLDEPTEGIQPSIVDEIGDLLVRLKAERGIAMLLVEQFLDFAFDVADGCYVMEKGAIVMNGDIGEIDLERVRSYLAV